MNVNLNVVLDADRNDEKVLNDDTILFIFHVNAEVTYGHFQKMAGWPIYMAVRCRNKSFFIAPVQPFEEFLCNCMVNRSS